MKKMFIVSLFALVSFAPAVHADHQGHYDVTCWTRNARGQRFQATGDSEFARDGRLWNELQEDATEECRHSRSLICIPLGCTEFFHHER